ncbi:MAG: thymidine phosphorylase [Actinobacteria bacterium]|nr:MAG: thymidine phosphorylase [Actinomycetota bacterium]
MNHLTAAEMIAIKRDGGALNRQMIEDIVLGITDGSLSDAQVGAFAMAVRIRGMNIDETVMLTDAMRRSGTNISWHLDGPVVDKHSTGGVGDTVSLMLAPMLAACGAFVPMISGRGLGHTGGTTDKMEAIPGYITSPTDDQFHEIVRTVGCAIIGQTNDLAPADRRLYSIRDVTGTVESIPLICSSILSKKLASGTNVLAMNVTTGGGAFMSNLQDARELAKTITDVARGAGVKCHSLVTDMDQPLGSAAGNALEVRYAIDYLHGIREDRMHQVVIALGAMVLVDSGLASDTETAEIALEKSLSSGHALEKFAQMVTALGGPVDFVESSPKYLVTAPVIRNVIASQSGWVSAVGAKEIGMTVVVLGGGRTQPGAPVDWRVGVTQLASVGNKVEPSTVIAQVHAASEDAADIAESRIRAAISVSETSVAPRPVLIGE